MLIVKDVLRKLYCHLNGCPIVYLIACSFIIHTICSLHPGLTLYLIYIYTYKSIKNRYIKSKECIKQNQTDYEDIELEVEILKTKLCVVEADLQDRSEPLRHVTERLRKARSNVFELIAADDALRHLLYTATNRHFDDCVNLHVSDQYTHDIFDNDLSTSLLNGLILKTDKKPTELPPNPMDCGENGESESSTKPSDYSAINDIDMLQDCRVKIVKVTNVYKVAYLKHYIKQKRLRRANKRALLKKKVENIKLLFEDWQKTLNMVTNGRLSLLNYDSQSIDVASQEAMGDYTKPCESSDSDSDMRNEIFYDEYCRGKYESALSLDYENQNEIYSSYMNQYDCYPKSSKMVSIKEETTSQMAIEDVGECGDDGECRDIVAI